MELLRMSKTKYPGVFIDAKGNFYYETELGTDKMSGKRVRKKGRKDSQGMPFNTAFAANKELTRVKREYHKAHGFTNFRMTYRQFMKDAYIPAYKTDVALLLSATAALTSVSRGLAISCCAISISPTCRTSARGCLRMRRTAVRATRKVMPD